MSLVQETAAHFTELIASPAPVPGGGGTSALVASLGIALGDMTGEFTVGKKKYADVEEEIKATMAEAQELRVKLLACVDKDAEAFEPLSRAYGIPKDDPTRDTVMEACLKEAAKVPYEILELSARAIELEQIFATKGSKMVISDAATGVAMCRAALLGAAVNVKINTKSMKDREYVDALNAKVDAAVAKYTKLADEVFRGVYDTYAVQ